MTTKVSVSANALRQVLQALNGPDYLIRELQYTRNLPGEQKNPIDLLVEEFNEFAVTGGNDGRRA